MRLDCYEASQEIRWVNFRDKYMHSPYVCDFVHDKGMTHEIHEGFGKPRCFGQNRDRRKVRLLGSRVKWMTIAPWQLTNLLRPDSKRQCDPIWISCFPWLNPSQFRPTILAFDNNAPQSIGSLLFVVNIQIDYNEQFPDATVTRRP